MNQHVIHVMTHCATSHHHTKLFLDFKCDGQGIYTMPTLFCNLVSVEQPLSPQGILLHWERVDVELWLGSVKVCLINIMYKNKQFFNQTEVTIAIKFSLKTPLAAMVLLKKPPSNHDIFQKHPRNHYLKTSPSNDNKI